MGNSDKKEMGTVPCCPPLEMDQPCEILDFHYRQIYNTNVLTNDRRVQVEVIINTRLERCPGPFAIGNLVYTTTLFPDEKVRLFTQDRRTRFTYDSATKLSYRNQQTAEEHFYMSSMSDFMSDVTVRDGARSSNTSKGHFDTHAETSSILGSIFGSPSVDVSGNYNSESTSDFLRELSSHARSSHSRSEMATRAVSSISIGEVQSRSHAEGETQDHFEASSREFKNPNACHAITFFFYQINKMQTIKFVLSSIDRRVIDPAVSTKVTNNAFSSRGDISTIPAGILATNEKRIEVEDIGRKSVIAQNQANLASDALMIRADLVMAFQNLIPTGARQKALEEVDRQLVAAGLIDKVGGNVSPEAQKKYSFETKSSLPTPGIMVKGCIDECDICEPSIKKKNELDLEHKRLENELLKKQIELLEKSQEYRCCPANPEIKSATEGKS